MRYMATLMTMTTMMTMMTVQLSLKGYPERPFWLFP